MYNFAVVDLQTTRTWKKYNKTYHCFWNRLYLRKLVLLSLTYDTLQLNSATKSIGYDGTEQTDRFYKLTLKLTFLFIITILTGYLTLAIQGLGIGEYWLSFDHAINVLCIYLSYGFNDKLYDKLCGCFMAKYCYKCCAPLCFCCCQPKELPEHMSFAIMDKSETSNTMRTTSVSPPGSPVTATATPTIDVQTPSFKPMSLQQIPTTPNDWECFIQ